jgi:hypothetical protein
VPGSRDGKEKKRQGGGIELIQLIKAAAASLLLLLHSKTEKNENPKNPKTPSQACANQANLVNFFLRAHFNVDTLTKPCKKLWWGEGEGFRNFFFFFERKTTNFSSLFINQIPRTPSMAAAAYGQVEDFCANNIVFGTQQLCKSVGETGCVVWRRKKKEKKRTKER